MTSTAAQGTNTHVRTSKPAATHLKLVLNPRTCTMHMLTWSKGSHFARSVTTSKHTHTHTHTCTRAHHRSGYPRRDVLGSDTKRFVLPDEREFY
jgi:hypothetical protein